MIITTNAALSLYVGKQHPIKSSTENVTLILNILIDLLSLINPHGVKLKSVSEDLLLSEERDE